MNRFFWVIGIVLLVGTLVGVGFGFNHPQPTPPDTAAPPIIMAVGYVDGEFGVSKLFPLQPGRVVEVAPEGKSVAKGEVILRLDDELAELKLKEAQADHEASLALQSHSTKLPQQRQLKIEQQKAAIRGASLKKLAADNELKARLDSAKGGVEVSKTLIQSYEQKVDEIAELVKAEEAKLKEIELVDPTVDMRRADADAAAKKTRVEQAQWAVNQCKLVAPSAGIVLRVHVNPGEILGANPTKPAIEFLPKGDLIVRGEVLQEWADRVKLGKEVEITDDTHLGNSYKGKVDWIAPWFTQKRNLIIEPFTYNDVRYLECHVRVSASDAGNLRVGQRVRVKIKS